MAVKPGLAQEKILAFSARVVSRLPKFSMWASPMLVMTATSGWAMPERNSISPGWLTPSSTTAI